MLKGKLYIFKNPEELADQFARQLITWLESYSGNAFHLAISGGKTPDQLFSTLVKKHARSALWQKVHFWWVDERMVPAIHSESNFGIALKLLLSQILIPEDNIHRIKGENTPEAEVISYSMQIQKILVQSNGWPVFDLILLGMGDDGHTASIFPNQMKLLESNQICAVATHPLSGQKRVTLTGKVINNAIKVCFLVTGSNKADCLLDIWESQEKANSLPAAYIQPVYGEVSWYVDEPAAQLMNNKNLNFPE